MQKTIQRQIRLREGVLYAHCQELGISRDELARRMEVSSATAYRVHSGDVEPSPKFIAAFMHVTGKKFEDLFQVVEVQAA